MSVKSYDKDRVISAAISRAASENLGEERAFTRVVTLLDGYCTRNQLPLMDINSLSTIIRSELTRLADESD